MATLTPNTSSHPPIWRWSDRKSGGTPPRTAQRPEGAPLRRFPSWRNRNRPLWAEVHQHPRQRGVVVFRARGWEFHFPEDISLLEALCVINGHVPPRNR